MSERTENKNVIESLVKSSYEAAMAARILLEGRNGLFDARQYACSDSDDLDAIEENQGMNAVWILMDKSKLNRDEVIQAVDDLWDGERGLEETIEFLRSHS